MLRRAVAPLALVLAIGCGGGGVGGADTGPVTIRGTVVEAVTTGGCEGFEADALTGQEITFQNFTYETIGMATTGETTLTEEGEGCRASAPFEVTLPRETGYRARIEGALGAHSISYSLLVERNFEWILD